MYNTRSNTSIHFDSKDHIIPSVDKYDAPASFYTFKIQTNGSEVTYFFKDEFQLSEFLDSLKALHIPANGKIVSAND